MKIDKNVLIIDESLEDDVIKEFIISVNQPEIKKIVIKTDDITAPILQILWCLDKEIEVKTEFLKLFFENVKKEKEV